MPDIPTTFQRALRGHAVFRFVALIVGFAFQVIVVKLLPPEGYAIYAVLLATLLVGERLLSFGTDRTMLRFIPTLMLHNDRAGLASFATRLAAVRTAALCVFAIILVAGPAVNIRILPGGLSILGVAVFGSWFFAYSLLKEAEAIAQSLIIHQWAALVAACEVFARISILVLLYAFSYPLGVMAIVGIYALTSWAATIGLGVIVWTSLRTGGSGDDASFRPSAGVDGSSRRRMPAFAASAYASTLSYLISSPPVIRLVARGGLGVYELAAFSFVQGLAMSLSSALPGQLILPSLESIAAKMSDRGERERVFPALSLLLKTELVCVLSLTIASTIAGAQVIRLLSRPEYAPYFYVLPALVLSLFGQTVYRLIEIIGSMNLKYRIFLSLWPLSLASMVCLYFTVGRWGLISVLAVPLIEILIRVGILTAVFRKHGIVEALDPPRSAQIVLSALVALLAMIAVVNSQAAADRYRPVLAATAVLVFLVALFVVRPLSNMEYDVLSRTLPQSWSRSRHIAALLVRR